MNNDTYALLIGIDCYLTQQASETRSLNLNGCVSDINRIETFLLQRIGISAAHILKLTSTNTPTGQPLEPVESWPTRENIISGFRWLGNVAQAGDQVLIYYSGHGARVKTPLKFQRFKPGDGFDEALVPCDYNYDTDQFVRDFEIADILRRYRDRGLEVTIVLDSCHSGGNTRTDASLSNINQQKRARTVGTISETFPDPEIAVASDHDLQTTMLKPGRARDFNVENGWLLEPEGYVLLAACRPTEYAYEHPFDGNKTSGALTYWLLESLVVLGPQASFETLYNRILAHVHEQFPDQTPQLQGERNRVPFKHERVTATPTVPVLGVNGMEIILGAGQAQNVRHGQQFAIFRAGATDIAANNRRALVSVIDVGATSSRATIVEQSNSVSIEKGDQALAVQSGKSELKRTVELIQPEDSTAEIIRTFKTIEEVLRTGQNTYIALATNGAAADFAVDVTQAHEYVIGATFNGETQRVLSPMQVDKENAAAVIKHLEHMAKYLNVYDLQNHDPISPLRKKITLELLGVQSDYLPGNKPSPEPIPTNQPTPEFRTGQWTFLKIKNDSTQVLNITVLDLRPNWSINQIYPARAAAYEPLDPGHSVTLPLRASLPDGYDEGTDLIKIIATSGPSNFRFLELPPLAGPQQQVAWRGEQQSQFEALQNALTQPNITRDFETQRAASAEWTTTEVKLRTMQSK